MNMYWLFSVSISLQTRQKLKPLGLFLDPAQVKAKGFPVHSSGSVAADLSTVRPCWPVVCSPVWFLVGILQLHKEKQLYSPLFLSASVHGDGEPLPGGV